jgi:pimeloyl-ACP methyl ester carboxylesterase
MVPGPQGSSLYVEEHGSPEAPAILFTHGWGMDSTFWNTAKRDLHERFRVVTWDLPGLGKSKLPADRQVSLERYADDLVSLIVREQRPVVLVGHSIGGMIIQTVLRDHPDMAARLAGVILLNTTYTNPLRTMIMAPLARGLQKPVLEPAMWIARMFAPLLWLGKWQSYLSGSMHIGMRLGFGRFVTRDQLGHVALLAARASPNVEAKGNLAMFRWDSDGAISKFPNSALVIGGDVDIVTKLDASRVLAEGNPNAVLHVVQGVNHMGPLERADLYNGAIAEFVAQSQPLEARAPFSDARDPASLQGLRRLELAKCLGVVG